MFAVCIQGTICIQGTRINQAHAEGQRPPDPMKLPLPVKLACVRGCVSMHVRARPPPGHQKSST